ncbi:MAG: hypothetical protein PVSMB4_08940 [Ktedonobacterales bacterium]
MWLESGGADSNALARALKMWGSRIRAIGRRHVGLGRRVAILILALGFLALPLAAAATAFQDYQQLRTLGEDGLHHLLAAKQALLPSKQSSGSTACSAAAQPSPTVLATPTSRTSGSGATTGTPGTTSIPDAAHLATAQHELHAAQLEFRQLADLLDRPDPTLSLAVSVPAVASKATTARELVYVGEDASTLGLDMLSAVTPLLTRLHAGVLSKATTPLITTQEAAQIRAWLVRAVPRIDDVETRLSRVHAGDLPVNACQRAEFERLTGQLPVLNDVLAQAPAYFDAAMWLAGVDHPRQFLVQTMDRSELRPTGGFTGDYGVIVADSGRVKVSKLHDVDYVDYHINCGSCGRPRPAIYEWWPFPNWGLRDSNLSPDFPTTAKVNMQLFHDEHVGAWLSSIDPSVGSVAPAVDGVIAFTPAPIAHILLVTGPITLPDYGDTITATNLEDRIHYWQNDPAAIAREGTICPGSSDSKIGTRRKCFTQAVAKVLQERVRSMSMSQLMSLAKVLLNDMTDHEIQVYVTNPQIEDLLIKYGYATHLTTLPGQDSLMIDQANVSVAKSAPFIKVAVHDDITLDAKGGATHQLTMTFANTVESHFVDGYTTYRDYVRIYVPEQARLLDGNGFDTGTPLCWAPPLWSPTAKQPDRFKGLPVCSPDPYPDRTLVCPSGGYGPGPRSYDAFGGDSHTDMPLDYLGMPPNTTSDVAGRAMFGGYVVIPNYCSATLTLSWYVPNVALPARAVPADAPAYQLAVEHQVSTHIPFTIQVQPAKSVIGEVNTPAHFQQALDADALITIPRTASTTGGV